MIVVLLLANALTQSIEAPVGETIRVELEDIGVTGYIWRLEPPQPTILALGGSDVVAAETGMAGAAGRRIFTLRTVGPGDAVLTFALVRPWEKDVAPLKTATLRAHVR
jgi:predicted secreted protein